MYYGFLNYRYSYHNLTPTRRMIFQHRSDLQAIDLCGIHLVRFK